MYNALEFVIRFPFSDETVEFIELMFQKHRQVLILLVGLLYVYSICPFLCATFEQKFCHDVSQETLSGNIEMPSTCCQRANTGRAGEAGTPSESRKPCCSTDLELVLRDDRHNSHESRELIEQPFVSMLPISATSPVATWESFQVLPVPLTTTFFPDHSLSRRGPPFVQC